jgi:hypothetical protein
MSPQFTSGGVFQERLPAWVLLAFLAAVAITATALCSRPRGSGPGSPADDGAKRAAIQTATALKQDMRKLWTDHDFWMRSFIVATVGDYPDAQHASQRLQQNQDEIGAVVGRYYGRSTGDQLTALLKEHVWSTLERVRAVKAGDEGGQSRAEERAARNAAQIADLLSQANPNWSRGRIYDVLTDRLANLSDEIDARVNGGWDADVKAFDASHKQILKVADAFAEGIVRHYPEKFGG